MDFISKEDVFEMAKASKLSEAADGVFFLVFWEDNQFGVVTKNDLVNIAVSELTEKVYGQKCEAMYGTDRYHVTLIFRGKDEDQLYTMANKCDGIWRKNKNSQPQTKKRVSKPNLLTDFEMDPNSEDTTTPHDQSAEGQKKVQRKKQGQQNIDVASRKKKQDKGDQNVDSVPPKKKSKEELQKEKKERQISRNAAMEAATKWIEEHATNVSMETNVDNINSSVTNNIPATQPNTQVPSSPASQTDHDSKVPSNPPAPQHPNTQVSSKTPSQPPPHSNTEVLSNIATQPSQQPNTPVPSTCSNLLPPMHPNLQVISTPASQPPPHPNTPNTFNLLSQLPSHPNTPAFYNPATQPPPHPFFSAYSYPSTPPQPHPYYNHNFFSTSNSAFYDQPQHNLTNPLLNTSCTSNDKNHVTTDIQPSTSSCMSTALRALQFVENDNNDENVDIQDENVNILNEECQGCINKSLKIEALSCALEKAQVDNEALLSRIRCLEEKTVKNERQPQDATETEVLVDHYIPSRGLQIDHSNYKLVPLDQAIPPLYERIGGTEVSVPQKWMVTLLSKCKGKGSSFTIKKMLDGFFEPQELVGQKASSLRNNKIIQAIRLYTINKFHVKDSDFNGALNSKIHTCKRASTKIIQKK
ncbi:unnamed protein product [Mytilus coruscus]|uniref:BEN domain-containing protein n=1 Tax=Mytilus coruscus TaxID=42192 RepID=A0A6J8CJ50_MYTCO|nr:unnamed protein product [Mytilus coruscus]